MQYEPARTEEETDYLDNVYVICFCALLLFILLPAPPILKVIFLFVGYVNIAVIRYRSIIASQQLPLLGRQSEKPAPVVKNLGQTLLSHDGYSETDHEPLSLSFSLPLSRAVSFSPGEILRQVRFLLTAIVLVGIPALAYFKLPPNVTVEAWLCLSTLYFFLLLLLYRAFGSLVQIKASLKIDEKDCVIEEKFLFMSTQWKFPKEELVSVKEDDEYIIIETKDERTRFPGPSINEPRLTSRLLKNHSIFLDDSPFDCLAYERVSDAAAKKALTKGAHFVPRTLSIRVGERKLELSVMKRSQLPLTVRDVIEPLFALDPATKNSRPFDAVVVLKGRELKAGENWFISFRNRPQIALESQGWTVGPTKGCSFKRPETDEKIPPPLAEDLLATLGILEGRLKRGVLAISPSRVLFVHPGTNVPANVLGPIFRSMTQLLDIDFSEPLESHHFEIIALTEMSADSALCQVCGEMVRLEGAKCCPRCDTAHHHDCWEYMGGCSIYGCK